MRRGDRSDDVCPEGPLDGLGERRGAARLAGRDGVEQDGRTTTEGGSDVNKLLTGMRDLLEISAGPGVAVVLVAAPLPPFTT